jgi:hypothetical protein
LSGAKEVVVELNGFTVSGSIAGSLIQMNDTASLSINGEGTIENTQEIGIYNTGTGTLNITDVTVKASGTGSAWIRGIQSENGKLNVTRGKVVVSGNPTTNQMVGIANGLNSPMNVDGTIVEASNSGTIEMHGIWTHTSNSVIGNVNINVTSTGSGNVVGIGVYEAADAVITNSTITVNPTAWGVGISTNKTADATINGGTITINGISGSGDSNNGIYTTSSGVMNVNNVTIVGTRNGSGDIYGILNASTTGGVINVEGGSISVTDTGAGTNSSIGIYMWGAGTVNANETKVDAINTSTGYSFGVSITGIGGVSTANLTNLDVTATSGGALRGIEVRQNSIINIDGGSYIAEAPGSGKDSIGLNVYRLPEYEVVAPNIIITIGKNDGTISKTSPVITGATWGINPNAEAIVNFYDGVITGSATSGSSIVYVAGVQQNIPEDASVVKSSSTGREVATLEFNGVAKIGDREYVSLQKAVAAAVTGDTIEMIANSVETVQTVVNSGKTLTLNLNEFTVSGSVTGALIQMNDTASLSINGEGTIENKIERGIYNTGTGTLNVTDVTIKSSGTGSAVVRAVESGNGPLNVTRGKIVATGNSTIDLVGIAYNGGSSSINIDGTIVEASNSGTGNVNGIWTLTPNSRISNVNVKTTSTGSGDIAGIGVYGAGDAVITSPTITINPVAWGAGIQLLNTANAEVNGGTITINGASGSSTSANSGVRNYGSGTVNVNNVTIIGSRSGNGIIAGICNDSPVGGIMDVEGGTISVTHTADNSPLGIFTYGTGTVNANETKIDSINSSTGYAFGVCITGIGGVSTANLTNLDVTVTGSGWLRGIEARQNSAINIDGGSYIAEVPGSGRDSIGLAAYRFPEYEVVAPNSIITIGKDDGGISKTSPVITGATWGIYAIYEDAIVNFYDGVITGSSTAGSTIVAISGVQQNIPEGASVVKSSSTGREVATLKIDGVAKIGDTEYVSLQKAVAAAVTGDTIEMIANSVETVQTVVNNGKVLTLNLNNFTVSGSIAGSLIQMNDTASLSINGEGTIENRIERGIYNTGTGSLNITDVTVKVSGTGSAVVRAVESNSGSLNVTAGKIVATGNSTDNIVGIGYNGGNSSINIDGTIVESSNSGTGDAHGIWTHTPNSVISNVNVKTTSTGSGAIAGIGVYGAADAVITNPSITINPVAFGAGINTSGTAGATVNGGTITVNDNSVDIDGVNGICHQSTGTINVNNVAITGTKSGEGGIFGINVRDGETNIKGGTISVTYTGTNSYAVGIHTYGTGTLNANGTTINAVTNNSSGNPYTFGLAFRGVDGVSTANLTNLNVTVTGTGYHRGIDVNQNTVVNIDGGSYVVGTPGSGKDSYGLVVYQNSEIATVAPKAIVTIGKDDGGISKTSPIITAATDGIYSGYADTRINFYDGVITGSSTAGSTIVAISGVQQNIPEGASVVKSSSTGREVATLKIDGVAKIGDTEYVSLQKAVAAATTGDTIEMIANSVETVQIIANNGKMLTLDLNNFTISGSIASPLIQINDTASLTINGTGTIENKVERAIYNSGTGTLNVTDVTIKSSGTGAAVVRGIQSNNGALNVTGGKIVATGSTSAFLVGIAYNGTSGALNVDGTVVEASNLNINTTSAAVSGIYTNSTKSNISNVNVTSTATGSGSINGIAAYASAEATITNPTVTINPCSWGVGIFVKDNTNVVVNGGTIVVNGESGTNTSVNAGIESDGNAVVEANNLIISGTRSGNGQIVGAIAAGASVMDISGGSISMTTSSTSTAAGTAVGIETSGTGTLNASSIQIIVDATKGTNSIGVFNSGVNGIATMNLTNLDVTATGNGYVRGIYQKQNCVLNIYGGSYIAGSTVSGKSSIGLMIQNEIVADKSIVTIGKNDGGISKTSPVITGETYGLYAQYANTIVNFYDGIITGSSSAGSSIKYESGVVVNIPEDTEILKSSSTGREVATLKIDGVAKIGDVEYASLQKAVAAAVTGDTIEMIANSVETVQTVVNNGTVLTLDLNNFTVSGSIAGSLIKMNDTASLTINGTGTIENKTERAVYNSGTGTLNITDVTVKASGTGAASVRGIESNNGTLNVARGKVVIAGNNVTTNTVCGILYVGTTGILNIDGTVVEASNSGNASVLGLSTNSTNSVISNVNVKTTSTGSGTIAGIGVYSSSKTVITNPEITINPNAGGHGIIAAYSANATINGGTITINGSSGTSTNANIGVRNYGSGTVDVNDVTITGSRSGDGWIAGIYNDSSSAGVVNTEGGKISVTHTGAKNSFGLYTRGTGTINANETKVDAISADTGYVFGVCITGIGGVATANLTNLELTATGMGHLRAIHVTQNAVVNIDGGSYVAGIPGSGKSSYGLCTTQDSNVEVVAQKAIVTIGEDDGGISKTSPVITGGTYGIYSHYTNTIVNFYDGVITGSSAAGSSLKYVTGVVQNIPTNSNITKSTVNSRETAKLQ